MEPKTISVMDGSGQMVEAQVDIHRWNAMDGFLRAARILDGAGAAFGRGSARDAVEAHAFLVNQLAYVEPTVYAQEYQARQYVELLPGSISFSLGEHIKTVEYEVSDRAGKGRRTSTKGDDIPTVDVSYRRLTFPVEYGTIGYEYSQEELRMSAFLKRPLSTTLPAAALEGFEDHMNDVALLGEAESNLTGLFNNANIPQANRPSGTAWVVATPDLILSDVNAGIAAIWAATKYSNIPVKMVVPPSVVPVLQAPRSGYSDKTILQWIMDNNMAKSRGKSFDIVPGYGLDTAGAGGTKRVVFYSPGEQNMTMHIPLPLRFLAPQLRGLMVRVPGEYKYSGLAVRRPKTALYYDGV